MIRTPEELIAYYEAEKAETDTLQAREDLLALLATPGWRRIDERIRIDREAAFQQLRATRGTAALVGEATIRWQMMDSIYEELTHFIRTTIEAANEIMERRQTTLEENLLKEQFHGRPEPGDPGGGDSVTGSDTTGSATTGY